MLYLAYNIAAALTSIPAGHVSDRVGPDTVLVGGAASFLAAYAMFAGAGGNLIVLGVAFVLAGFGIGCLETAEHAAVATNSLAEIRRSAFGALAGIQSFGNLAASGIAGVLWTVVSPTVAFIYIAGWMGVAIIALVGTRPVGGRAS